MAMRECDKCLEDDWSFKKVDGWIKATCNQCGHEVEFESKRCPALRDGADCRSGKCSGKIHKKVSKFKPRKLLRAFFYSHTYMCDSCKKVYLSNEFKIKKGTKEWHKYEQQTAQKDKTTDWIRLQQGNGHDRNGVLEKHNDTSSKGKTYLPAV